MQIIVKLTNSCNLKCVYCSEGDTTSVSFLEQSVFYKLVDDLPDLLDSKNDSKIDFLFHGGEPLTYGVEQLALLMDYALEKLKKKYVVNFLIQSNGTLIDDSWIGLIKRYNIKPGFSLDGYRDLHDQYRVGPCGEPTFEKIVDNLRLLERHGINFGTLMVLDTSKPIDLDNLFVTIKTLGWPCKIHPVIPCGRACNVTDSVEISKNYLRLMRGLLEKAAETSEFVDIEPIGNIIQSILGKGDIGECSYAGSCCVDFLCLFSDGSVSFCGRSGTDEKLIFGRIQECSLSELYYSAKAKRIRGRQNYLIENDCKNCSYFRYCHGGCVFEAVNAYGIVEHKAPSCDTRKRLMKFMFGDGLTYVKRSLLRERNLLQDSIEMDELILDELRVR